MTTVKFNGISSISFFGYAIFDMRMHIVYWLLLKKKKLQWCCACRLIHQHINTTHPCVSCISCVPCAFISNVCCRIKWLIVRSIMRFLIFLFSYFISFRFPSFKRENWKVSKKINMSWCTRIYVKCKQIRVKCSKLCRIGHPSQI